MNDESLHTTIADADGVRGRLAASLAGRYRIAARIGVGGMATVWLADDVRHKRQVAIKVLTPQIANSIGTERFSKEIEIAGGLRHARILPLYDSGEADGLLYYVMPLIEGESLRQRIERRPALSVEEAVRLVSEAAEALTYAHARDVVHRDIKPENIMLEEGHALVTDFGIARAVMGAGDARLTSTGMRIGTPLYMSPEQATSDGDVDARTDQYSLACVLFEMLAGRPPFTGASGDAILIQRFTQPPPRLATLRGDVPTAVDNAVYRAMARDPTERFASVQEFAAALRPAGAEAGAASASSIAVLPFANMSGNPAEDYFADGISEEIINALSRIEGLRVAARTSTFAFKGRHEDLRQVGEKLNVATVLEGSVRKSGNRLRITAQLIKVADGYHLWSERYDRELTDIFEIQDEIAGAIAAKLRGSLAPAAAQPKRGTSNLEAYDLFLQARAIQWKRGRYVLDSTRLLEQAVALDPKYADAWGLLGDGYRLLALYGVGRPEETMPKARRAAERALDLDPNEPEALTTLADVAHTFGFEYEQGLALWKRAYEANPDHVRMLGDYGTWGVAVLEGRHEDALAMIRHAIEIDPLSSWAAGIHVLALVIAGRNEEALSEAKRAVELDPSSFLANWQMLTAQLALGDARAAIETVRRTVDTWRHPWYLGRLGVAFAWNSDRDSAQAVLDELRARARTDRVQDIWLAAIEAALGRVDEAMELALRCARSRDSIAIWMVVLPECAPLRKHPRYPELLSVLKLDEFWRKHPPQRMPGQ